MLDKHTIRRVVAEVARRNGAHKAILFGSYARGTATAHSDVDLLFVEPTKLPFLSRIDRYFDPLIDQLKTGVELFVYTPAEFDRMAQSGFVAQAVREGIVLYESGEV